MTTAYDPSLDPIKTPPKQSPTGGVARSPRPQNRCGAARGHYDGEWRVRHADGVYRWVRIPALCVRDATGRAMRMGGEVVQRALESGANEVLKKPLSARELAMSLARVLHA
jgi:hypothetical protein